MKHSASQTFIWWKKSYEITALQQNDTRRQHESCFELCNLTRFFILFQIHGMYLVYIWCQLGYDAPSTPLVKASTRWLQESCFELCNFTGAHHYKHNAPACRVITKSMVFTHNLTQDELILHTCKIELFLMRGKAVCSIGIFEEFSKNSSKTPLHLLYVSY